MEQIQRAIIAYRYFKKKSQDNIIAEQVNIKKYEEKIKELQKLCEHEYECYVYAGAVFECIKCGKIEGV